MTIIAKHTIDAMKEDHLQRLARAKQAWLTYYGQTPDQLKIRKGAPNDNVKVNYARLIVEKGVAFLFGKPIKFELDQLDEKDRLVLEDKDFSKQTAEELWLEACWKANKQDSFLMKLATNGGVVGTFFAKIVLGSRKTAPYPRLIILDPSSVEMDWERDDMEDVFRYRITWRDVDRRTGRAVHVCEVHERSPEGIWWIWEEEEDLLTGQRTVTSEKTQWPYSWPAIVHNQNLPAANELWGVSDLEDDIIGVNKSLNFILSNLMRIIRYHAHPKTWGSGFKAKELEIGADDTIVFADAEASLQNLEMSSDLASSIQYYKMVKRALHEVARVPEASVGAVENMGPIAGVALLVLYQPLVEKTDAKRVLYGEFLQEVCSRLLEIGGFEKDLGVKIHWPQLLPRDALMERQVAQIDSLLGISLDTIQSQLGYDPDLEKIKKKREAPEDAPREVSPVSLTGVVRPPEREEEEDPDVKE
jgi:hypothetical protein